MLLPLRLSHSLIIARISCNIPVCVLSTYQQQGTTNKENQMQYPYQCVIKSMSMLLPLRLSHSLPIVRISCNIPVFVAIAHLLSKSVLICLSTRHQKREYALATVFVALTDYCRNPLQYPCLFVFNNKEQLTNQSESVAKTDLIFEISCNILPRFINKRFD